MFFDRPEELLVLPDRHPELTAYLPLKITIFTEAETSLAATNNPAVFETFFKDPALTGFFRRWEKYVCAILYRAILLCY